MSEQKETLSHALCVWDEIKNKRFGDKKPVLFLDYDGTLTPIVDIPSEAVITDDFRRHVQGVAKHTTVAIITGRGIPTISKWIKIPEMYIAGSHGFDVRGPNGTKMKQVAGEFIPDLKAVAKAGEERVLEKFPGSLVEDNEYSVSIHYRNVDESQVDDMLKVVDDILAKYPNLKKHNGKKVWEIKPNMEWHKGKAVEYLMNTIFTAEERENIVPMYIGDDTTDEDAFKYLATTPNGFGINVQKFEAQHDTAAKYILYSTEDVKRLLQRLKAHLQEKFPAA